MTPLWWSILLAAVGILGLLLAGSKRKVGWAVGFGAQALWVVFAIVTGQYGFILSAVAYAVVYARNWLRWRREERERESWVYLEKRWIRDAQRSRTVDPRGVPVIPPGTPPRVGPKGGAGDSGASEV